MTDLQVSYGRYIDEFRFLALSPVMLTNGSYSGTLSAGLNLVLRMSRALEVHIQPVACPPGSLRLWSKSLCFSKVGFAGGARPCFGLPPQLLLRV